MRIVKQINNNAALAQDEQGNDLVVFGTGIGFHSMPYELEDMSRIQRVFRHVDDELLETISSISQEMLGVAIDIVSAAKQELDCELNPNLYLTLADHLQFAADRFAKGIVIENPLASEIPYVYPREYALGLQGLQIMLAQTGITLPDAEACSIALHVVNAETDGGGFSSSMRAVMESIEVINGVIELLEKRFKTSFDRQSRSYVRFVSHLRYLVKRLQQGAEVEQQDDSLLDQVRKDFSEAYDAAQAVARYFRRKKRWRLSNEELLYLMMHLIRFTSRTGV